MFGRAGLGISAVVPQWVRPEEDFLITVRLEAERPIRVAGVRARVVCRESPGARGGPLGGGMERLRLEASLSDARELEPGVTELPMRARLPAGVPPSFSGEHARVEYVLEVRAARRLWPDLSESFELIVAPTEMPGAAEGQRGRYASSARGAVGREPYLEASVVSDAVPAGGVVEGALALFHVWESDYARVTVSVQAMEYAGGAAHAARPGARYELQLPIEAFEEGRAEPFRFRLPEDAAPGFDFGRFDGDETGRVSLEHELTFSATTADGRELRLSAPFTLTPRRQAIDTLRPHHRPAPAVGEARRRELWAEVGYAHGLRAAGATLEGRFGEVSLSVCVERDGAGGARLTARLGYPDLGLELALSSSEAPGGLFFRRANVTGLGDGPAIALSARDEQQVQRLFDAVFVTLGEAFVLSMDDRELVLGVDDAGQNRRRLDGFCNIAIELAERVDEALDAMPPPTGAEGALGEWRALAISVGGRLDRARLRVESPIGEADARVELGRDEAGAPASTVITVAPRAPLDERAHRRFVVDGAGSEEAAPYEGDARGLVDALAEGAHELVVDEGGIRLTLPRALGLARPGEEALSARDAELRLARMARLARALRGDVGPYR